MKIHRFIGKIEDIEITKQIRNVLKLKAGEQVIVSDGKGHNTLLELTNIGDKKNKIEYKVIKNLEPVKLNREVNLYLAVLKKENFELAVQKAVEVGVSNITPIITERTIKTGLKIERLQKIITEASEQSGRDIMPTLFPILNFKDALENGKNSEEKIIFHLGNNLTRNNFSLPLQSTGEVTKNAKSVSIFIGPEGGFTDKEINLAKESDYKVASLGPLTLRAETAAIVATYRAVSGI